MKFLALISFLAVCVAAAEVQQEQQQQEEQVRTKRGFLSAPLPVSYSSSYIHHAEPVAVAYHVPLPAVKVIKPLPITKFVAPAAVAYTKVAYPSVLPYYGYSHGYAHGYGHGFGYFH